MSWRTWPFRERSPEEIGSVSDSRNADSRWRAVVVTPVFVVRPIEATRDHDLSKSLVFAGHDTGNVHDDFQGFHI